MDNMHIYGMVAATPKEAQKTIQAGRLKGFTDINPMHRIKLLTQVFGPCGIGWKYDIKSQRLEKCDNGEVKAFVDIDLFYKYEGEWSAPIPGIGGSSFVSMERNGAYVNDECFKSALSDAIGTACKSIGMSADIYYSQDRTKYIPIPDTGKAVSAPDKPAPAPRTAEAAVPTPANVKELELILVSIRDRDTANAALAKVGAMNVIPEAKTDFAKQVQKKAANIGLKYSKSAGGFIAG